MDYYIQKNSRNLFFYFFLWVIYGGIIIFLSSLPGNKINKFFFFKGQDKILHCFEYSLYAFLTYIFFQLLYSFKKNHVKLIAIGYSLLFALLEELHQMYVPGRSCSPFDFLADSVGVFVGIFIFYRIFILIEHKNRKKQ